MHPPFDVEHDLRNLEELRQRLRREHPLCEPALEALYDRLHAFVHRTGARQGRLFDALSMLLESAGLKPEEKQSALNALKAVRRGSTKHRSLLSPVEDALVEQYRRMDNDGRHLLRTLLRRLAPGGEMTGGAR